MFLRVETLTWLWWADTAFIVLMMLALYWAALDLERRYGFGAAFLTMITAMSVFIYVHHGLIR